MNGHHDLLRSQAVLLAKMDTLEMQLRDLASQEHAAQAQSIEEFQGKKQPFNVVLDVPLSGTAAVETRTASYTHSQTGDFIAIAIGATWRETAVGRYRPISSVPDMNDDPPDLDGVDFLWDLFEDGGSYRMSNENRLPSALLFSSRERPFYLAAPLVVTPGTTLTVTIETLRVIAAAGTLHFALMGYKNLDPAPFVQ